MLDPDPELDEALSPLRSLLLNSRNGMKRRRLGRLFAEVVDLQLSHGVPAKHLYEHLLSLVEASK